MGAAAIVTTAISAISKVAAAKKEAKAKKKEEKEREKARRVDQAIASRENQRKRRQAVREARIKRADIVSAGAQQGVLGSSGVQGGAGSVVSQGAAGVTNIDQTESLFARRNVFLDRAADAASDAARARQQGETRGALISAAGSIATSSGIFNNSPSTTTVSNKQNVAQSGAFVPQQTQTIPSIFQ